jgi:hypothetical protein
MNPFLTAMRALFHRSNSTLNVWLGARSAWSASDTVQIGFTGARPELGRCAAELLKVITSQSAQEQMVASLGDSDPKIVAYSLAGLELLNSAALDNLPGSLFARKESVRVLSGSSLLEIPLKIFAEEVTKRRAEGRSLDRWLSYGHRVSPESLTQHLAHLAPPTPDSPTTPRG